VRANSEKEFFHCSILESIYLIFLVALLLYVVLHVYFFIVIIELYLELKAQEPTAVAEDVEAIVVKDEELQLLESPKSEQADETDKAEGAEDEKPKDEEAKEDAPAKSSRIRCPELPKCPSLKCPSWGNCVGPDNFQ
jgi:predicted Holliday junction resolvase-like endonuclease